MRKCFNLPESVREEEGKKLSIEQAVAGMQKKVQQEKKLPFELMNQQ